MTSLGRLDRILYALFATRVDAARHDADRRRYRGTALTASFDVYLARVYGLSWVAGVAGGLAAGALVALLPPPTVAALVRLARAGGVPVTTPVPLGAVAVAVGLGTGVLAKWLVVRGGGRYLAWVARARRADIDRTLPGAVRYLHVLAAGTTDERELLRQVAALPDAYGETATAVRNVVNVAELTGSLDVAIRRVARDTPSRNALAPFLLQFHEHADQGPEAVADYLRVENQLHGHRRSRIRDRATGFLELVVELFVVLLVAPALFVVAISVLGALTPGLDHLVGTPVGRVSYRALLTYGSAGFVLLVGALAAWVVGTLRPVDYRWEGPSLWADPHALLVGAVRDPAAATVVFAGLAVALAAGLLRAGLGPLNVAVLGYVGFALPVGAVSVRRARLDDAKDREIEDFVHAVAGRVRLGRPFTEAVEDVAREIDLGVLDDDVTTLAFRLGLTTHEGEQRAAALDRFVAAVGTPFADQTVGLVTGALDVGGEAEAVFEALQAEVGRLYHEKRALRSQLLVYVVMGWVTAVFVLGVTVAVGVVTVDGLLHLALGATGDAAGAVDAADPGGERRRLYAVTQATMLACGWFAGAASRGRYEALLHSGALAALAYVAFAALGLL